jgi:hypothetical protein
MSALSEARRAVQTIELLEHAATDDERLDLTVDALAWLCLAAVSLQEPAADHTTKPMPAITEGS